MQVPRCARVLARGSGGAFRRNRGDPRRTPASTAPLDGTSTAGAISEAMWESRSFGTFLLVAALGLASGCTSWAGPRFRFATQTPQALAALQTEEVVWLEFQDCAG